MKTIHYNKICIMCPTYHRSNSKLPKFINSVLQTIEDYGNCCFCFIVNKNDIKTVEVINKLCGDEIEFEILFEDTKTCNLSHYFNYAYEKTKFNNPGTCVSMFGDDMVFVTEKWDTLVLEKINEMRGYGLVYGDDDYCQHENLCVYFVTTRELVALTEKPFMCESFAVDFIDNVWMDFSQIMKCSCYLSKWHVRHDHAARFGNPDDVWIRMRTEYDRSHKNFIAMNDYVDEMVQTAKNNLKKFINPDISFCMTTYDRISLLQQTVNSWNRSFLLPDKIFVFDDNSNEIQEIINNVFHMENAYLVSDTVHLGCNKRNALAVTYFDSPAVMVIDSDTIFAPHWYLAVIDGWNKIKDRSDVAGMTIFNATDHKFIEKCDGSIGMNYKAAIGGFGSLYKKETIDNAFESIDIKNASITWPWDHAINDYAKENKLLFYCGDKSYLQHIGYAEGVHINDCQYSDFALDFVGEIEPVKDPAPSPVIKGGNVLFAAMARLGDIVAASMIVNMIIDQGMNVAVLVINRYGSLAKRIFPNSKIITVEPIVGGSQGEWSETTTEKMRNKYPGYVAYINGQIGSRENHQPYITSGLHPCVWLKNLCEQKLGISLSNDFRKYLKFNDNGLTFPRNSTPLVDNLAIICAESKTVPPLPIRIFEEKYNNLLKEGFNPRFIVSERPSHLATRIIREKYIYGLSIEQCILLIKKAKYFVGQDSGLSWCSLYSDCHKDIYHRKERIEIVNTFYRQIDENANDLIMGD